MVYYLTGILKKKGLFKPDLSFRDIGKLLKAMDPKPLTRQLKKEMERSDK